MTKAETHAKTNAATVRRFFDALNSGDLENVRPLLSADTVWRPMVRDMTEKPEYRGDAIIDDFLRPVRGIFKDGGPMVTLTFLAADEHGAAAETDGDGETQDGKVYANKYGWFFDMDNGRILMVREYFDSNYVARLLA